MGRKGRDDVADFLAEMQEAINELPLDDMTPDDAVFILTALRTVTFRRRVNSRDLGRLASPPHLRVVH